MYHQHFFPQLAECEVGRDQSSHEVRNYAPRDNNIYKLLIAQIVQIGQMISSSSLLQSTYVLTNSILQMNAGEGQTKLNKIYTITILLQTTHHINKTISIPHSYYSVANSKALQSDKVSQYQLFYSCKFPLHTEKIGIFKYTTCHITYHIISTHHINTAAKLLPADWLSRHI